MKKVSVVLVWLLFGLTILYPMGSLIGNELGYSFSLVSVLGFSMVILIISFCIILFDCKFEYAIKENETIQGILCIITPLSLINGACYINNSLDVFVAISVFLSSLCCFILTEKCGNPPDLKKVINIITGIMILPVLIICMCDLLFGNFGSQTVVQTVESPSGEYYAQVIDSDEGALGGDTIVWVYEKKGLNALIFKFEKKPQRVYLGAWGEFENMKIYWKDDSCLVINSVEHTVKK